MSWKTEVEFYVDDETKDVWMRVADLINIMSDYGHAMELDQDGLEEEVVNSVLTAVSDIINQLNQVLAAAERRRQQ